MKFNRKIALGAVALLVLAGAALAQIVTPSVVSVINPTDLIQVIPRGQTSSVNVYATPAQITSQSGYYKYVATTGFSYTFGNTTTYVAFNPAGALATGYIYLAPAPSDGARNCAFTTQTITGYYVFANSGQSINNAIGGTTGLSANTAACYLYSLSNNTWDRD